METITLPAASPANDNALLDNAPGVVGGIKSLLCDACGERAHAGDGYCSECHAEMQAVIDERRGGDEWMTDE